jgi:hypothetical protein
MIGETQVIVGGKIEAGFAVNSDVGGLRRIHAAQLAEQVLFAQRIEVMD